MSTTSTIVSSLLVVAVVIMAFVVPPAVSRTTAEKRDDAEVIKVAASCATRCRELCGVLPESEDPGCAGRCDSISATFNASVVKDPHAVDPKTIFSAVREVHMCYMGCSLRCATADAGCKARCADAFRLFGPAMVALGKTTAAHGLAPPEDDDAAAAAAPADLMFQASCTDACSRKCAAAGKTKLESCGGICAEACGFYGGVTTVLRAVMSPPAVPSPAALGDHSVANTYKDCNGHCAAANKDDGGKCSLKCSYACYILTKAKASMMLATGAFGLPA